MASTSRSTPSASRRTPGDGHDGDLDLTALAQLAAASPSEVAVRAQEALRLTLLHDATVLFAPSSRSLPVQFAAPPELRERLSTIDWPSLCAALEPGDEAVMPLDLPDVVGGLQVCGWVGRAGSFSVALVVGGKRPLQVGPAQERAAAQVAVLAAAAAGRSAGDQSPGTVAFARALNQERERISFDLRSRHAATLSAILHALRGEDSGASAQRVNQAIDLASQALLDLKPSEERDRAAGRVALSAAFSEAETEATAIVCRAGIRLVAGLDAPEEARIPLPLTDAARVVTRAAALAATRGPGAAKVRIHWRVTQDALGITVADDGEGADAGAGPNHELEDMRRLVAPLEGHVELEAVPGWGTTLSCDLPLYGTSLHDTSSSALIAGLREREREVLGLIVAGLSNRDIAGRLFISDSTVKFHVSNILKRLGVRSRTEAIAVAHAAGVRTPHG